MTSLEASVRAGDWAELAHAFGLDVNAIARHIDQPGRSRLLGGDTVPVGIMQSSLSHGHEFCIQSGAGRSVQLRIMSPSSRSNAAAQWRVHQLDYDGTTCVAAEPCRIARHREWCEEYGEEGDSPFNLCDECETTHSCDECRQGMTPCITHGVVHPISYF